MSCGQRELQTGDLVEITGRNPPWGHFVVLGAKTWKTLWVRQVESAFRGETGPRLAAARKRLRLVMPVEERVARLLMGGLE